MSKERPAVLPLGYVLKKSAYEAYHGIVTLVGVGVIFTALAMLIAILLAGGPPRLWVLALFAVPAWAGTFAVTLPMASGRRPSFRPFWRGVWQFGGRSLALTLLYLIIAGITYVVWAFWRTHGGLIGLTFAIFQLYAFGMFACAQLYTVPLMVKENLPVMKAMAMSARLFVTYPGYTLGVVIQLVSLAIVLALGTVALPLLYPPLAAVLITNATLNLTGELASGRPGASGASSDQAGPS